MERTPRETLLQMALEDALALLTEMPKLSMEQKVQASRIGDLAQQCGCMVPAVIRDYSRARALGRINRGGCPTKFKDRTKTGGFIK